jgi:hypothetical protein
MRRFNPFGDKVKPEPFNFCNPAALEKTLRGVVGWFVDDVVITREEIRGLMEERLYVKSSPLGTTKLSDWVHANRRRLGLTYTSEMARRLDRVSEYRSN